MKMRNPNALATLRCWMRCITRCARLCKTRKRTLLKSRASLPLVESKTFPSPDGKWFVSPSENEMRNLVLWVENKIESKKRSEKKTGRDKHGHKKTVGDREGPGIEKKWKQLQKEKIGGQRWAKVEKTSISCFGVKVKNVKKRQTFTVVIIKNIYKQNVWKERDLRFLTNIFFQHYHYIQRFFGLWT